MSKLQDDTVQIFELFKSIYNKISNNCFDGKEMTEFLQKYVYIYTKYIGNINIQNLEENFLRKISENDSNYKLHFFDENNNFIYNGKHFYVELLIDYLLSNLIDNCVIKRKFIELTKNYFECEKFFIRDDIQQLINSYSSFELCFDDEMHFYLLKKYTECSKEQFKREKKIMMSNYSKFIIPIVKENEEKSQDKQTNVNQIYFPYIPFCSLSTFVQTSINSKPTLKLTDVDKVVILLEIADALNNLHDNNEYHNNIDYKSILISSTKDAYLHNFYKGEKVDLLTTPPASFYYQTKEEAQYLIEHKNGNLENYNMNNTEKKKKDIYSYGVLLITIFSEKSPNVLFDINDLQRNERLEIMRKDYIKFLLHEDEEKNSENEEKSKINEIINNYMNNSYDSFSEVIESIKGLQIYKQNEEEIEKRILLAPNSSEYECKLSDLVKCYLYGNEANFEDISKFLLYINKLANSKEDLNLSGRKDIINQIFNVFDIKPEQIPHEFHYLLNFAIQKNIFENKNSINIDFNDPFLQLSLEVNHQNLNEDESNNDLIIPVSSLSDFIKYNSSIYKKNQLYFIYSIARDISLIHSKNLSINNLSTEKIGVYYNASENIFAPSIILFYSFFKRLNEKNISKTCQSHYPSDYEISKKQQKDIDKFYKIFQNNCDIFENEFFIDNGHTLSMNIIVNKLYNYIQKNESVDKKQVFSNSSFLNDNSSFNIDYPSLMKLIDMSFNFDHSFFSLNKIFSIANELIDKLISDPNTKIIDLLNIDSNNQQEQQDYYSLKSQFFSKCITLYKILNEKTEVVNKEAKKEKKKYKQIQLKLLDSSGNIKFNRKTDVSRYVEFSVLSKQSFRFLFLRYLLNLKPEFSYKITIKIQHPYESQSEPINEDDVHKVISKIDRLIEKKPVVQNDTITFSIKPLSNCNKK